MKLYRQANDRQSRLFGVNYLNSREVKVANVSSLQIKGRLSSTSCKGFSVIIHPGKAC